LKEDVLDYPILYRTLPQIGRFLKPEWRRQFAADASSEAFPTESVAICRLQATVYAPVETFLSKNDQIVAGESIGRNFPSRSPR